MILIKTNGVWAEKRDGVCREIIGNPYDKIEFSGKTFVFDEKKLDAPCTPSKIVCVGKNYRAHALELGGEIPATPIIFLKPVSALNHHNGKIVYPKASARVDYEGELALVIKKKARHVKASCADDYILGYTCLNDVTARDIQALDGQWTRAKSFDTFAPVGAYINTDLDPSKLRIETRLNGKTVQLGNTSDFIWSVPELIEFITQCMTLMPGDVVTTGTPAGIGGMCPGDTVEVDIEKIGILKNTVIGEDI